MIGMPVVLLIQDGGDCGLLMALYDRYSPMILAMARAKAPGQDAEDILCETLDRLIPYLPRIAELLEPQRKAYVYAVARSVLVERLRARAQEKERVQELDAWSAAAADTQPGVEEQVIRREQVQSLRRAIRALPEEHRAVLGMRYVQEMDATQIGQMLNMKGEAVRQLLRRLRGKIKRLMEEE